MRYLKVSVFLFVVMFSATIYSQGWGAGPQNHGMKQGHGPNGERVWQELNLSEKQKTELKDLRKKHWEEKKSLGEEMRKVKEDMRIELEKESPDMSKLRGYSKSIGQLSEKISNQVVDHLIDMKKILTPEQYKKMLDMKKNRAMKKKGGRKGGPRQDSINR